MCVLTTKVVSVGDHRHFEYAHGGLCSAENKINLPVTIFAYTPSGKQGNTLRITHEPVVYLRVGTAPYHLCRLRNKRFSTVYKC